MADTITRERKRRGCGLVLLVALAVVALALVGIDGGLKGAGKGGYCPGVTAWTVTAADFPAFWVNAVRTDAVTRMRQANVRPWGRPETVFRVMTGRQPTPARWRRWFGPQLVAAQSRDGWGICVRPGILMRLVEWSRRGFSGLRPERGVHCIESLFYAWRDGCLIVSPSRTYVVACLEQEQPARDVPGVPLEVWVRWKGPPEGAISVRAENGFPVRGWLQARLSSSDVLLTLPDAWPEEPVIAVSSSSYADIRTVLSWVANGMKRIPLLAEAHSLARVFLCDQGWNALPDGWDRSISEVALAIMDVDTTQVVPVPEVALLLRQREPLHGAHPLAPLAAGMEALPYDWSDHEGLVAPIFGEKVSLCLGQWDSDWLAASQEPLMAFLVGRLRAGRPVNADMTLTMNWAKVGACAEVLVRRAGAFELVPRMNADDVEAQLAPWARATGRLGRLQIDFRVEGDRMTFEGFLARGAQ